MNTLRFRCSWCGREIVATPAGGPNPVQCPNPHCRKTIDLTPIRALFARGRASEPSRNSTSTRKATKYHGSNI